MKKLKTALDFIVHVCCSAIILASAFEMQAGIYAAVYLYSEGAVLSAAEYSKLKYIILSNVIPTPISVVLVLIYYRSVLVKLGVMEKDCNECVLFLASVFLAGTVILTVDSLLAGDIASWQSSGYYHVMQSSSLVSLISLVVMIIAKAIIVRKIQPRSES